jgi:hypothetical protein
MKRKKVSSLFEGISCKLPSVWLFINGRLRLKKRSMISCESCPKTKTGYSWPLSGAFLILP